MVRDRDTRSLGYQVTSLVISDRSVRPCGIVVARLRPDSARHHPRPSTPGRIIGTGTSPTRRAEVDDILYMLGVLARLRRGVDRPRTRALQLRSGHRTGRCRIIDGLRGPRPAPGFADILSASARPPRQPDNVGRPALGRTRTIFGGLHLFSLPPQPLQRIESTSARSRREPVPASWSDIELTADRRRGTHRSHNGQCLELRLRSLDHLHILPQSRYHPPSTRGEPAGHRRHRRGLTPRCDGNYAAPCVIEDTADQDEYGVRRAVASKPCS